MARPFTVQPGYRLGMKRDGARESMNPESVWNAYDWLPEVLDARLRKRGGYEYASENLATIQATASYVAAGIFAGYSDGSSVLAFDEDGRAYEIEATNDTEDIGAALATRNPFFYDDMVIVPHSAGTTAPKKITRSSGAHTIANLGGSPPAFTYGLVHKDVCWGLRTNAAQDTIYFSAAGDPETWDTTDKWLAVSYPIVGGVAMANSVLVFNKERTVRIRGSIPPPDSDFIVDDPIFDVGCTDNRSIATYRDKCVWANGQGLYITDGSVADDLTKICGMKSWWREVMAGRQGFATGSVYDESTWSIAGGVYGDFYFYSIMNGSTEVDSGMIDLTRYTWMRLKNIDSVFFFERPYPEELFFGRRGAARVAQLSDIFNPTSSNESDADGTAVLPVLETAYFEGQPGTKTMKNLFVGYDIRDSGSNDPTLEVSYIDSPEETSYTALTPELAETTEYTRRVLNLDFPAKGIALKVEQTAPSSDTRLYAIEAEAYPREGHR